MCVEFLPAVFRRNATPPTLLQRANVRDERSGLRQQGVDGLLAAEHCISTQRGPNEKYRDGNYLHHERISCCMWLTQYRSRRQRQAVQSIKHGYLCRGAQCAPSMASSVCGVLLCLVPVGCRWSGDFWGQRFFCWVLSPPVKLVHRDWRAVSTGEVGVRRTPAPFSRAAPQGPEEAAAPTSKDPET